MKLLLSLSILFLFTSCENPTGQFTVDQKLKLKRKTVLGNTRYVSVPSGKYKAKATIKKKKITLKIDGIKKKVSFKIPAHVKLPSKTTSILLPSHDIGQNYDLKADVIVNKTISKHQRRYETCQYTRNEYRCRRHCDKHGNCRSICENVPVTVYGHRNVEFYNVSIKRDYELALLSPRTDSQKALFEGTSTVHFRDYTYQGICR